MKKIQLLLIPMVSVLSCTMLREQVPPNVVEKGGIFGTIKYQGNNAPIQGASVIVLNTKLSSETNSGGEFEILNVPDGKYNIHFTKKGYDTVQVEDLEIKPNKAIRMDVILKYIGEKDSLYDPFFHNYWGLAGHETSARRSKSSIDGKDKSESVEGKNEFEPGITSSDVVENKDIEPAKKPVEKAVLTEIDLDKRRAELNASKAEPSGPLSEESAPPAYKSIELENVKPLQAAAHNDNEEYPYFLDYLDRFGTLNGVYHHVFKERLIVKITDGQERPLFNVPFQIVDDKDSLLWQSVTYSNGENVVFPHVVFPRFVSRKLYVKAPASGKSGREPINLDYQKITSVQIPGFISPDSLSLDLMFILDTTGSMGDEIQQLKDNLYSIYTRIRNYFPNLPMRFGLTLYRDKGDQYIVQPFDFNRDINEFQMQLDAVQSGGGGDTAEDVQAALETVVRKTAWNSNAVKVAFLVGDAQPHIDYGEPLTYIQTALEANRKGIKLFTIGASGLGPEGEYAFRQLSALTYGEFLFLTYGEKGESDGTGTGKVSHHTGDNYESHNMDDLVVGIVKREILNQMPGNLAAGAEVRPRTQENYLRIRMDNLWIQIKKQLDEFMKDKPVAILPHLKTSESRLDTLARFLQDISTVSLVESQKIPLVERERLEEILSERKLSLTGLIDSQDYDQLGFLAGANVIFLGELSYTGMDRVVFMRAVKTNDSRIVAAARIRL